MTSNKKVLVAMSGGVDSSAAALLLKEAGWDVLGVTMKLYDNEDIGIKREKTCCSLSDVEDARNVAALLGFPYYVMNFSDEFEATVMRPFVEAYEKGMTPNPCVVCNRFLKFGSLLDRARALGCDAIATGHYARVAYDASLDRYLLMKAKDETKDQTYMLYTLTQEQLSHVQFPLGDYDKPAIRQIAEENGLVTARKRDSQDICFVQNGSYADFIERYAGKTYPEGNFVDKEGRILGRHKGIIHYTLGQRKGLGLALPQSMFVIRLDLEKNEVVLGFTEDLMRRTMVVKDINLIPFDHLEGEVRAHVKARYSHKAAPAVLRQTGDDEITVTFDEPQRAITPGQAAVFYLDEAEAAALGIHQPIADLAAAAAIPASAEPTATAAAMPASTEPATPAADGALQPAASLVLGGGTITKVLENE